MLRSTFVRLLAALALAFSAATASAQGDASGLRLYVLDGGVLTSDPTRYHLTPAEVEETALSIASFLIVHPRGVLLWDTGAVPERERVGALGTEQRLVRRDGGERFVKLGESLVAQLAAAGFTPRDVTHLALSHYHWDHTADANLFAHAHWLASPLDRDRMFSANPPGGTRPETYSALANSETTLISSAEHDVFGDGTVVIKQAPGHTEGHAVLYVELANTGPIVLSGDLYHYPEERTLNRLPTGDVSVEDTAKARAEVDRFLERKRATLWIQHDLVAHRKLKKAPEFYD